MAIFTPETRKQLNKAIRNMQKTINSEKTEGATVEAVSGSMLAHRESVEASAPSRQAQFKVIETTEDRYSTKRLVSIIDQCEL